jgi:hypothetical protein
MECFGEPNGIWSKQMQALRQQLDTLKAIEGDLVQCLVIWRNWYQVRTCEAAAHAAHDNPGKYHVSPAERIARAFEALKGHLDAKTKAPVILNHPDLHAKLQGVTLAYLNAMVGTAVHEGAHTSHWHAEQHYKTMVSTSPGRERLTACSIGASQPSATE